MEVVERSGNAWKHFSLQSVLSCEPEIEEIALVFAPSPEEQLRLHCSDLVV